MSELIDISLSFPTVVFTVVALIAVGYWVLSASLGFAGGIGADADFDLDLGGDPDVDSDVDVDAGTGPSPFVTALGLHLVPASVSLTVLSLVAWFTSVAAVVMLGGTDRRIGAVMALATVVVAPVVGTLVAGRAARVLAPVFATQRGERHADLIGRLCTVQTGRVDTGFGQGLVRSPKGDEHVVQIRCRTENRLAAGDVALLVDVDDGIFLVSPDTDALI